MQIFGLKMTPPWKFSENSSVLLAIPCVMFCEIGLREGYLNVCLVLIGLPESPLSFGSLQLDNLLKEHAYSHYLTKVSSTNSLLYSTFLESTELKKKKFMFIRTLQQLKEEDRKTFRQQ